MSYNAKNVTAVAEMLSVQVDACQKSYESIKNWG